MLNQYARSAGHMPLVTNLAANYSKTLNRQIDAINEVVVTDGACKTDMRTHTAWVRRCAASIVR